MKTIIRRLTAKRFRKTDIIFIIILIAGLIYLYTNPVEGLFQEDIAIADAYTAKQDAEGNTYVIDNGHARVLKLDKANEVLFSIVENNRERDTITYASDVAVNKNGDIFVGESHWGGLYIDREAILVYDAEGKYKATCYDETYDKVYVDKRKIYGMTTDDNYFYFAVLGKDEIVVNRMDFTYYKAEQIQKIAYENAFNAVYDICIDIDDQSIYLLDKRCQIVRIDAKQKQQILYRSSEDSQYTGKIAPYMLTVDKMGEIYFTDIKGNNIFHLNQNDHRLNSIAAGETAFSVRASQKFGGKTVLTAIYGGKLCELSDNGNILFSSDILQKSGKLSRATLYIYLVMAVCLFAAVLLLIRLLVLLLHLKLSRTTRSAILLSGVVIVVVSIIVTQLMSSFRSVYTDELFDKLYLSAHTVSSQIDSELIEQVNTPEDFMSESYNSLMESMEKILDRNYEFNQNIYCNILKFADNEAFSVAYLDQSTGSYYPLDDLETREVLKIYMSGKDLRNNAKADVAGSFAYVKSPIFDSQDKVIAVVAIGSDTSIISNQISEMQNRVLVTLVTIILVLLFLFGEGLGFIDLRNKYKQDIVTNPDAVPLHMIRVIIFVTFIAFNMATSFLSVYAARLVSENIGIPKEFAASLPLTLNLAFMGIMSLFCAPLMARFSFRSIAVVSAGICLAGDMTIFLNTNSYSNYYAYYALLIGLILNGIGVGLITNCINMFLASSADPDIKRDGFSIFNSSSTSGINIGSMAGASLAGALGQQQVFAISSLAWVVVGVLFFVFGKVISKASSAADPIETTSHIGFGKFIISPRVWGYMVCIQIPYIMLNSFIFYYVPLYGAEQGFTENTTCLLLMVNSLCSVFFGVALTDLFIKKFKQASIYISTVMSLAGLILFAVSPTVPILVITLLIMGISNSFGVSSKSVYFTRIPQVEAYGEEESMGIYNLSDNVGESVGPMVFGSLMSSGNLLISMLEFTGAIFGAGMIYVVGSLNKQNPVGSKRE